MSVSFPETFSPTIDRGIYTSKLTTRENRRSILTVIWAWTRKSAVNLNHVDAKNRERAEDSFFVLNQFRKVKKKQNRHYALYVAFDSTRKIQAVLLKSIPSIGPFAHVTCVEYLVTNPDNIPLDSEKTRTRGAGTALLKHVAFDMKQSQKSTVLVLSALKGAIPFYKKIGLEEESCNNEAIIRTRHAQVASRVFAVARTINNCISKIFCNKINLLGFVKTIGLGILHIIYEEDGGPIMKLSLANTDAFLKAHEHVSVLSADEPNLTEFQY